MCIGGDKMNSNLKRIRTSKGISQSELSKLSGVNFRMLQNYEQGVKNIDGAKIETLANIARVLNCGISEIMDHPEKVSGVHI